MVTVVITAIGRMISQLDAETAVDNLLCGERETLCQNFIDPIYSCRIRHFSKATGNFILPFSGEKR